MLLVYVLSFCATAFAFRNPYPRGIPSALKAYSGEELFLTPLIEAGEIQKARTLASVAPLVGNITSYSGFLTVNKTCGSNIFFWFFPAQSKNPSAPLGIWLQGGPGATSLFGLFSELGAYELTPDNKLQQRKYSWSEDASFVFFDNPVGTGFSFTQKDECYAKNQVDVGRDLLNALKQLLKMFPEYVKSPLFITGESYGGKYVPALSYAIHKDVDPKLKINLQGLAIGNAFIDPIHQSNYTEYLYQLSLLGTNNKVSFLEFETRCINYIAEEKWKEAHYCFEALFGDDDPCTDSYLYNLTGFSDYFNFLYPDGQPEGNLTTFLTTPKMRRQIHVGNAKWNDGRKVAQHLIEDEMQSVRPWLEELLEHYRVMLYSGQLDIIVPYPLTENFLKYLKWSGADAYKKAERRIWKVGNEIAGYTKSAGKLTEVVIRNAGHMVPMDQPKWAFDMIYKFFKNKPL